MFQDSVFKTIHIYTSIKMTKNVVLGVPGQYLVVLRIVKQVMTLSRWMHVGLCCVCMM